MVAAALAALAFVVVGVQAAPPLPHSWATGLPGCNPSAPAVAHHADQQVLAVQPTDGPVPCGVLTGFPTVETRIEVKNDNQVVYEPALTGGPVLAGSGNLPGGNRNGQTVAVTSNDGSSWTPVTVHVFPGDQVGAQVDNNLYVDHTTGRLFWYMYSSSGTPGTAGGCGAVIGGATVAYTEDSSNWGWGFDRDHDCSENPTVLTAVPTVSAPGQMSYPNVVYLCGDDASSGAATLGTSGFSCSKSLNGGATWLGNIIDGLPGTNPQGWYSGVGKDLLAPYPQCAGQSSSAGANVQPFTNGTLVVVVSCNKQTFLSESKDEGATWNIVNQIPHGGTLRIDSADNMFFLEKATDSKTGQDQLLLSHSTDRGVTWSPELNMVAPGVHSVGTLNFAQGTFAPGLVGEVAVTYYGINPQSASGKNGYSDGFISTTRDALDPNPLFWSGQVNSANRPLLYNTTTDGNPGVTVLDFIGGALSADGNSVWGSWVQDCGTNILTSPSCLSRYPGTNPVNNQDGFAGRLVWPPARTHS